MNLYLGFIDGCPMCTTKIIKECITTPLELNNWQEQRYESNQQDMYHMALQFTKQMEV